ncbi:MAG: exodeoxyribonuclease VII large subunit, partial [Firmicutes bacterium]|nr:exodeoxyribonuclease VII large subunit [Bacillota bacterium]
ALVPVLVQGAEAPAALVKALHQMAQMAVDVVIIGRGGGSKEDLMAFNDEAVVRAAAGMPMPIISAVGHEIDTTLVDLAADLRAPTPSAAAELAVPELAQLLSIYQSLQERTRSAIMQRLSWERRRLSGWVSHGALANPLLLFRERRYVLDRLGERLDRAMDAVMKGHRVQLTHKMTQLESLNPHAVLQRGYAYVLNEEGQAVSAQDIRPRRMYMVHWADGSRAMQWDGEEGQDIMAKMDKGD